MRVLFSKINCPFICFCKPSPSLYTPSPLKLENTPHVPHNTAIKQVATANNNNNNTTSIEHGEGNGTSGTSIEVEGVNVDLNGKQSLEQQQKNSLKSNLKKHEDLGSGEVEKKRVQWIDFVGKQLVQIREFEASEPEDGDSEDQNNRSCVCVIL